MFVMEKDQSWLHLDMEQYKLDLLFIRIFYIMKKVFINIKLELLKGNMQQLLLLGLEKKMVSNIGKFATLGVNGLNKVTLE
jgi:hypothetical protein